MRPPDFKATVAACREFLLQPLALGYFLLFWPAFCFWLHDLFDKSGDLPSQVAMRLSAAQLLTQNRVLYLDFFEWSQPVVFEFGKFVYWLQAALGQVGGFRVETLSKSLIALTLLFAVTSSFYLLVRARKKAHEQMVESAHLIDVLGLPYILAPLIFSFYMRLQLGELQWFLALALAPWLILRYLRHVMPELAIPPAVSVPIGLFAGVTALTDIPFLPIYLLIELLLIVQNRSYKSALLKPESLSFVAALLIVVGHFFTLPEEVRNAYQHWVIPFKLLSYQTFDEAINGPGASPDQSHNYYLACAAILGTVVFGARYKLLGALAIIILSGTAINLLEKQGFTRDLLLTIYGAVTVLLICLSAGVDVVCSYMTGHNPFKNKLLDGVLARGSTIVFVLITVAAVPYFLKRIDRVYGEGINPHPREILKGTVDINNAISKNSKWTEPVAIFCDYADPAYPLLFNLERPNGGYFLTGRPIRLFAHLKSQYGLKGQYRSFYEHARDAVRQDFDSRRAALILVHGAYCIDYLVEAGLTETLDKSYVRVQDASFYSDNVEPREYLGYYFAFDQYARRPDDRR